MAAARSEFKPGDQVRPRPPWVGHPALVPSGEVVEVAQWGTIGALYVGDDPRAWSAHVFERVPAEST